MDPPTVFLSYSHDSPEHEAAVLALSKQLRQDGCNVVIDQEQRWVAEGWTLWMRHQIEQADFVLIVCTEIYQRRAEGEEEPPVGAGASWEGAIIRVDLYEANGRNNKFIPVLIHKEDKIHRPFFLRDYPYFLASDRDGYANLCAVLKGNKPKSSAGPSVWNIPPSNPYFFGRQQYLDNLRATLAAGGQPLALNGLGGMGNTQAALKYADLYQDEYSAGLWAVADSNENLISSFAEFARLLDLPEKNDKEIDKAAAAATRWLESGPGGRWLLILDNVEDWDVVKGWIPRIRAGHVIITTRLQYTGTFARGLDLPKMTVDEGGGFLLYRGKIDRPGDGDWSAAKSISEELGGLPLGLEQAGAYIEEASLSPEEYLALYRREGKKLRARAGASADHDTVTRTFTLIAEKLGQRAGKIVRVAACLAPDAIPEDVLAAGDEPGTEFRDAVADAARYSLIRRNPTARTIYIHRLVQDVVKDGMDERSMLYWIGQTADSLSRSFPENVDIEGWSFLDRLLPHARIVAGEVLRLSIESYGAMSLLNKTAWYLRERAQYTEAEPLAKRVREIREKTVGPEHPDTISSLNNLGELYESQGQYREAETILRRALEMSQKALGPDHPGTATVLHNLAGIYRRRGLCKEAESASSRALGILEKVLGTDHPRIAPALNVLAGIHIDQGSYNEAEQLSKRALAILEKTWSDQPDTAVCLNNLAEVYRRQGQYTEAEALSKRALAIREKTLGPNHPHVAANLNNLAAICGVQGRLNEAEALLKRALEISEKALGPDHPDIARCLGNLAALYTSRGNFLHAAPPLARALAIAEKAHGVDHPDVAKLAMEYSMALQRLGRGHDAHKVRTRFKVKP